MMRPKQKAQAALSYDFSLENHVPQNHLLHSIDRFVDLTAGSEVLLRQRYQEAMIVDQDGFR